VRKITLLLTGYVGLGFLAYSIFGSIQLQELYKSIFFSLLGFVATIHIVSSLSAGLTKGYGNVQHAKSAANTLRFIGFFVALLVSLHFLRIDLSLLLLGGSVGGIILGFAAQKTIENVFAGLLILVSRNVEIGDRIRVVSAGLPQTTLTFPPYKFYSYDYLIQGYSGVVEEISIFFTKVTLDSGLLMILPNSIFLTSGVVNITKTKADRKKMLTRVRYELPLDLDVAATLDGVKEKLAERFELRDVFVSEKNQDRNTFIIVIETYFEDVREDTVKSEILMELIKTEKDLAKKAGVTAT